MPAARSFQPVRAEPVESGREDGIGLRGMPLEGDGVGSGFAVTSRGRVSPRRARYFSLLRQRKVPKRKATLPCVSLRCATGNLRCSVGGCCRRTHCALARSVQTCCGKSEHEVRVSFGTRTHPPPCASRHAQKGVGDDPGHRYARPSRGSALRYAQREARVLWAERSDGPDVSSAPHPCWLRLRRGACGVRMRVEARMLRALTRRGCLNGARSAQ